MLGTILGLLIVGLVARAIVSGRQSMSILQTILLGIAGSFVSGFLGRIASAAATAWCNPPAGSGPSSAPSSC